MYHHKKINLEHQLYREIYQWVGNIYLLTEIRKGETNYE